MRLGLTLAALALGTTSALAQIVPGGFERSGHPFRSNDDEPRLERVQRRDDDPDFRRDERNWDRRDRDWDRRERDWNRRGPYRGPVISFGAPGYFVRTLPPYVRVVRYGGLPCRITITRRVTYRGDIVESERRSCPGRPDMVIQRR